MTRMIVDIVISIFWHLIASMSSSSEAPIRTTLEKKQTEQYAELVSQLAAKARSVVRDLDPMNDLTFLRIRSKKHVLQRQAFLIM